MEATELYLPLVMFSMLYKVVLSFSFVDEILSVTIQMKAIEQHFPVVLFIVLYKVKGAQINAKTWEALAKDRDTWRHKVKEGVHSAEQTARNQMASKGAARKERAASSRTPPFVCPECNKDCHSRIGLHSHSRRCALPPHYTIAFRDEDATATRLL